MTIEAPVTDLDADFSSPGATALPWTDAEEQLQKADVFWLSTVRPEGRPHVVPLIAVWLNGSLYFATGDGERKAKNLAKNRQVSITTGCNDLNKGLDIVVEGQAISVTRRRSLLRSDPIEGLRFRQEGREGWAPGRPGRDVQPDPLALPGTSGGKMRTLAGMTSTTLDAVIGEGN